MFYVNTKCRVSVACHSALWCKWLWNRTGLDKQAHVAILNTQTPSHFLATRSISLLCTVVPVQRATLLSFCSVQQCLCSRIHVFPLVHSIAKTWQQGALQSDWLEFSLHLFWWVFIFTWLSYLTSQRLNSSSIKLELE